MLKDQSEPSATFKLATICWLPLALNKVVKQENTTCMELIKTPASLKVEDEEL